MNYYAGIDVSLESSSVCIVDATGEIVKEVKVESHPHALLKFFKAFGLPLTVIGLEAGPLSQWLYAGLTEAGFVTTLMETRHVNAALSAVTVKTDRRDARGISQLLRMGWFPAGSRQICGIARGACPAGCAQSAATQTQGHRAQPPRHSQGFRPEGWQGHR